MLKFQIHVYKVSNKYLIIFLNVLQIRRLCFHAASCSSVSLTWTSCLRAETHQDAELILLSFNFTGFMFQRWNLWDVCFWCSLCDCSELCALCLFVAFPQHPSCITALLCWVHAVSRLKDESPLYSSGVSCGASIRSTVLNQWTVLETRRRAALIHSYIQDRDKVEARRCNQEPPPTPSVMSVFLKRESRVHITGGKSLRLQSLCSPLVKDAAIDLNHSAVIHDSGQKQLCSALMYGRVIALWCSLWLYWSIHVLLTRT